MSGPRAALRIPCGRTSADARPRRRTRAARRGIMRGAGRDFRGAGRIEERIMDTHAVQRLGRPLAAAAALLAGACADGPLVGPDRTGGASAARSAAQADAP